MNECGHPITLGDLVDYHLDELNPERAEAIEDHVFECSQCAARLDEVGRIASAVRAATHRAEVGANVTGAFLERVEDDGLTLRDYRLEPGDTVACSAGPEDLFVVRLAADFSGAGRLTAHVDFRDLKSGGSQALPPREVMPDLDRGEIVLIFPGSDVRSYPRSLWTITVDGDGDRPRRFGPFVMDHTP